MMGKVQSVLLLVALACAGCTGKQNSAQFHGHAIYGNNITGTSRANLVDGSYFIEVTLTNVGKHPILLYKSSLPWQNTAVSMRWQGYYLCNLRSLGGVVTSGHLFGETVTLEPHSSLSGQVPVNEMVSLKSSEHIDARISTCGMVFVWSSVLHAVDNRRFIIGGMVAVTPQQATDTPRSP